MTLDLWPDGMGLPGYVGVSFDGGVMVPDVYDGSLLLTSEDSGTPAYADTRDIRLDFCREITELAGFEEIEALPGESDDVILNVTEVGTVKDVDIAVGFTPTGEPTAHLISVVLGDPPNENEVLLKDFVLSSIPPVYDDETPDQQPAQPLEDLDDESTNDVWKLRFTNEGSETLTGTVTRYEVRLHRNEVTVCGQ